MHHISYNQTLWLSGKFLRKTLQKDSSAACSRCCLCEQQQWVTSCRGRRKMCVPGIYCSLYASHSDVYILGSLFILLVRLNLDFWKTCKHSTLNEIEFFEDRLTHQGNAVRDGFTLACIRLNWPQTGLCSLCMIHSSHGGLWLRSRTA